MFEISAVVSLGHLPEITLLYKYLRILLFFSLVRENDNLKMCIGSIYTLQSPRVYWGTTHGLCLTCAMGVLCLPDLHWLLSVFNHSTQREVAIASSLLSSHSQTVLWSCNWLHCVYPSFLDFYNGASCRSMGPFMDVKIVGGGRGG